MPRVLGSRPPAVASRLLDCCACRGRVAGLGLWWPVCARDGRRTFGSAPQQQLKLLDHEHIAGNGPGGIASYDAAEAAQEQHRSRFLAWKAQSNPQQQLGDAEPPPRPKLISFESTPIFTLGRRQEPLALEQTSRLERQLAVDLAQHRRDEPAATAVRGIFHPEVKKTSRGGLTTYHGPGQLVLWPVLDMHSPLYARYSVSSYASHLEATTQRLLADVFGIRTYISRDEPGVWVAADSHRNEGSNTTTTTAASSKPPRKIAALGVHHRRYVTALGIALNVDVPVAGAEGVNPWARFVPCGLEGKLVTSVAAELAAAQEDGPSIAKGAADRKWDIGELAGLWARMFDEGLVDSQKRSMDGEGSGR